MTNSEALTDAEMRRIARHVSFVSGSSNPFSASRSSQTAAWTTGGGSGYAGGASDVFDPDHDPNAVSDTEQATAWKEIWALPTLAEAPILGAALRAVEPTGRAPDVSGKSVESPPSSPRTAVHVTSRSYPRRSLRNLRAALVFLAIALIAASAVLIVWSLIVADSGPGASSSVDLDAATAVSTV